MTRTEATVIDGSWTLATAVDRVGRIERGTAPVTLTIARDGRLAGRAQVTSFGGRVELGDPACRIEVRAATAHGASVPELVAAEARYLAALGAVDACRRICDTLELSGPDIRLVYVVESIKHPQG